MGVTKWARLSDYTIINGDIYIYTQTPLICTTEFTSFLWTVGFINYMKIYTVPDVLIKDFAALKHWPQAKTFWVWKGRFDPLKVGPGISREFKRELSPSHKLTSRKVSFLRLGKYFLISPTPLIHLQRSSLFFRRTHRDFSGMIELSDLRKKDLIRSPGSARWKLFTQP